MLSPICIHFLDENVNLRQRPYYSKGDRAKANTTKRHKHHTIRETRVGRKTGRQVAGQSASTLYGRTDDQQKHIGGNDNVIVVSLQHPHWRPPARPCLARWLPGPPGRMQEARMGLVPWL